ncbi:IclR family transcriptional regulator [Paenibacillus thalictri]|uniref:IclR family transcriptional regulator n=1 Tax=Paenibacillus thalictri TaxID=2527873 RepID=A0A4Q9DIP2_9BACL|nr:IclR family transcriptional regulator C-terminal domain-containing protein [Paenibacillus thalictri]TBL71585.1 IclR family transcriptional regulator [Paenibacillus thalictri]
MSAPGLESGLQILGVIGELGDASFIQLKHQLQLSPASLSRYLKTLTDQDFLEKNDEQRYMLGPALKKITAAAMQVSPFDAVIAPVLGQLSETLGLTALWISFEYGSMVCRDKVVFPEGVFMQDVGSRRTDYTIHPWGFLFLAHQKEQHRRYLIENAQVSPSFQKYIPVRSALDDLISEALEQGYSDDRGVIFPHIRRIAVPLFSYGRITAAIGVGMIDSVYSDAQAADIAIELQHTAAQLMKLDETNK